MFTIHKYPSRGCSRCCRCFSVATSFEYYLKTLDLDLMFGLVWISKRVGVFLFVEDDGDTVCRWLFLAFDLWFFRICWYLQFSRCFGRFHHTGGSLWRFKRKDVVSVFLMAMSYFCLKDSCHCFGDSSRRCSDVSSPQSEFVVLERVWC